MARNNEPPESGPIGNRNPDKRGRGSGEGPNKNVKGSGRRRPDPGADKQPPGKDKGK